MGVDELREPQTALYPSAKKLHNSRSHGIHRGAGGPLVSATLPAPRRCTGRQEPMLPPPTGGCITTSSNHLCGGHEGGIRHRRHHNSERERLRIKLCRKRVSRGHLRSDLRVDPKLRAVPALDSGASIQAISPPAVARKCDAEGTGTMRTRQGGSGYPGCLPPPRNRSCRTAR